ncbi:MAG: hypothetical protein V7731_15885 [Amphritea sp.]
MKKPLPQWFFRFKRPYRANIAVYLPAICLFLIMEDKRPSLDYAPSKEPIAMPG